MSYRFIFSTRYLGEGFAFTESQRLATDSVISEYLENHFWNNNNVWEIYKGHRNEMKSFFEKENVAFDETFGDKDYSYLEADMEDPSYKTTMFKFLKKNKLVVDWKKELMSCVGMKEDDKFDSRFSYYTLKSTSGASNHIAFAIPHLNWKPENSKWMKCLIEEGAFTKGMSADDILFLIMHDNDVPNYANTPIKVLDDSDDVLTSIRPRSQSGPKVKVIVFQHSSNDIVDILINQDISENDVVNKILSLITNKEIVTEIFKNKLIDRTYTLDKMNGLSAYCSVDLNDEPIKLKSKSSTTPETLVFDEENGVEQKLASGRPFYIYSDDNGALLNELMHIRMSVHTAKLFDRFVFKLREPGLDIGKDVENMRAFRFPIIIKVYRSFFDDWANAVNEPDEDKRKNIVYHILNHRNKKAMEENLERVFSFFNNSSIWIRLVDMYDEDAFKTAVAELEYFNNIGLYDYDSAWENLEYYLRIFSHNYLESSLDGHGNYVTPMLYGNETEAREILCGNHCKMK